MEIQQLKTKLQTIVSLDVIGINVFFIMKNNRSFLLKKADIRNDATEGLKKVLLTHINEIIAEIDSNDELRVINLSAADDRTTVIYEYDLDEQPEFFSYFENIQNNRQPGYYSTSNRNMFRFETDSLMDVDGYILRFGDEDNSMMVYRKNYPVNVFKRDKIYLIKGDETQFTTMKDDFLRIDSKIDFFKIDDSVFIKNVDILEKFCEFKQIIIAEATCSIAAVSSLGLVENIEVLNERVGEMPFARKLTKVSRTSPVFTLPKANIINFAKNHRLLKKAFKYSENGSIILDTKSSQNLFIRLLNDDFLHSELTNNDYVTPAKDKLD
ncbi:anti-phage protein KwaB [Macellibacteroides fermentans]|uniref:DUF4868 domain-containing protein n=1 Tax=Parabacteroides chartae TaxID=1037355 RepID=A0A1T5CHR4_9BACT|nr:anti-phage protein KwaB [Parabacteroides chartae]MBP6355821.1 DUF4868 domain-containing protein [Paludibacter sp.]SKB59008.1 protein of unknown function [Parabacteroides chartae]